MSASGVPVRRGICSVLLAVGLVGGLPATAQPRQPEPATDALSLQMTVADGRGDSASAAWPCEGDECRAVADGVSVDALGQTIEYTLTATNGGQIPVEGVKVQDTVTGLPDGSCSPAQRADLQAGASIACTATYKVTQADLDRGHIDNTASLTTADGDAAVTIRVPVGQAAGLAVSGSANKQEVSAVGELVTFETVVSNTGLVTLSDVALTDPLPGMSTACRSTALAPGDTLRCTGTYTVTVQDLQAGGIRSAAQVEAARPDATTLTAVDTVLVAAFQTPVVRVEKEADVATVSSPEDAIEFTYTAQNTGNMTLADVTVDDPLFDRLECDRAQPATLEPGEGITCRATHGVTQVDIDRGGIDTAATATGSPPDSPPVRATARAPVPGTQSPRISVTETAEQQSFSSWGARTTTTLEVSNAGNVTLTGVTFDAPGRDLLCYRGSLGGAAAALPTRLAPGESLQCRTAYTTTQADIDDGAVRHETTVRAASPAGPVQDTASVRVAAQQIPAIAVVTSAAPEVVREIGDKVRFTHTVRNTGNVTVRSVELDAGELGRCRFDETPALLSPGQELTCTATHRTTAADLDAGSVQARAVVTARAPDGTLVSAADTGTVEARPSGRIRVTASADPGAVDSAGSTVEYRVEVRNTGSGQVTGLDVTADGLTVACPVPRDLPRGNTLTCIARATMTQGQVDEGEIRTQFLASATAPDGTRVGGRDEVTVEVDGKPGVELVRTPDPASVDTAGQQVRYTYVVHNPGNRTLSTVAVRDATVGLGQLACDGAATLAPGEELTCTADYSVTQDDLDAGRLGAPATVSATAPDGSVVSATDAGAVRVQASPRVDVQTSPVEVELTDAAETVSYTAIVTNTGNVTVADLDVSAAGTAPSCTARTLAPGQSATCVAQRTLTGADVDSGGLVDRVAVSGSAGDRKVRAGTSVVSAAQQTAGLALQADTDADLVRQGDKVRYTLTATNSGNQALRDVTMRVNGTDVGKLGCTPDGLAPGEQMTCTLNYTVTADDVSAGAVATATTAVGSTPVGRTVRARAHNSVATESVGVSLAVDAEPTRVTAAGEQVVVSVVATNEGSVMLTDVRVEDTMPAFSPRTCQSADLEPGGSLSCTITYTVRDADVLAGSLAADVRVAGTAQSGAVAEAADRVSVPVDADGLAPKQPEPAITLDVTTEPRGSVERGAEVLHTYEVTNTGDTPLTRIEVTDDGCGPVDGPSAPLAPGASAQYECRTAAEQTTEREVAVTAVDGAGQQVEDSTRITVEVIEPKPKRCPVDARLNRPKPKKVGERLLVERIDTDPACKLSKPKAVCRPLPGTTIEEGAFCQTLVEGPGRVRVRAGGFEAARIKVRVRARPTKKATGLWRPSKWQQTWVLR